MINKFINDAVNAIKHIPSQMVELGAKVRFEMPQNIKESEDGKNWLIEKQVNWWYEHEKTKPNLRSIRKKYKPPVAILGGGPSLPEDLKNIPKDAILISANHHACRLVEPDYLCFLDPWHIVSNDFKETYKKTKAKKISHGAVGYTDFYCINECKEAHKFSDSGIFAAWVGGYITTGDIYLCGMNLRLHGEPMHFYDSGLTTGWGGASKEVKIDRWVRVIGSLDNKVTALSGPLKEII